MQQFLGHSFWDTETWMYPTFAYLYPETAQEMINYRLNVLQAARDRANSTGYKGARFPWEGAVTGREVTPDCCPETRDLQIHITSDISYAVRQYIAVTRDLDWLRATKPGYIANGCTMVREMAEFWASRAEFNTTTGFNDIRGTCVMHQPHFLTQGQEQLITRQTS
jgi:trehalose/maltose hydrolase-like predicted phosphorylase